MKLFLGLGVLGGAALALLAGLATARRAMEPIAGADRGRARDRAHARPVAEDAAPVRPTTRSPSWPTTLESMLHALDDARTETEATLARQREFVADASHELRTPLTSVLANLELLEETLDGEQREAAASALRSSRRMRRLVADLLLLARADAGPRDPRTARSTSRSVVADAASELEPVAGRPRDLDLRPAGVEIEGVQDELHRLVLNLMENALRHTDPGTAVEASVERVNGHVVLAVEDDGPGIPPELQRQGLRALLPRARRPLGLLRARALAIVRAVAESHSGSVTLEPPLDGRGARFVVRFPAPGSSNRPEPLKAQADRAFGRC